MLHDQKGQDRPRYQSSQDPQDDAHHVMVADPHHGADVVDLAIDRDLKIKVQMKEKTVEVSSTDTGWVFFRTWLSQEICGVLVTFTGSPSLGMVMFLGILQVISLSRTLASQFTPAIVMTMVMQELTRFSF